MIVFFDPLADKEYRDAFDNYETQKPGLGEDFRNAVGSALQIVLFYPEAGPEVRPGVRKILLKRFPYKLIYSITDKGLYIIALAHGHRAPEYWLERA
ncbi:MAG: type II toxin-antitoxin system RelE/ParE family toxin [Thermodesulfobacteriota bacterium]